MIIIGGGPAGLSASIYSSRNGLDTLVLEKGICGGLIATASHVANFVGFSTLTGMELSEKFKAHAEEYSDIRELEEVRSIESIEKGFKVVTVKEEYLSRAVILAMGARHAQLCVKGESDFTGTGVSYCATCDGFFYRGRSAVIVGGGNAAVLDALHLHDLGAEVHVVHRRDQLRAERSLQEALMERGVDIIWDTVVKEIKGGDSVEAVVLQNVKTRENREMAIDGVFVTIGVLPNSELAKGLGVKVDAKGFIETDRSQRTNIPGIYAAGDITGGVKQALIASSEGAVASLTAFEDMMDPYWA